MHSNPTTRAEQNPAHRPQHGERIHKLEGRGTRRMHVQQLEGVDTNNGEGRVSRKVSR